MVAIRAGRYEMLLCMLSAMQLIAIHVGRYACLVAIHVGRHTCWSLYILVVGILAVGILVAVSVGRYS